MTNKEQEQNKFQQLGRVKVVQGSILSPHNAGLRFILNIANMAGTMDSPLYPLFDKKWPKVKQEVRGSFVTKTGKYQLGSLANVLSVQSDVWVLSMLCQDDKLKTDAAALEKCLKEVAKMALYEKATVHCSTLLTDTLPELQSLLTQELVNHGVSVSFYEEAK